MIKVGKQGCLCMYWGNDQLLLGGFPLSKSKTIEFYKKMANDLIIDGMRHGHNIKSLIGQMMGVCHFTHKRKKDKNKISGFDLQVCLLSMLALAKLEIIDFDENFFIAPKKKVNQKKQQKYQS